RIDERHDQPERLRRRRAAQHRGAVPVTELEQPTVGGFIPQKESGPEYVPRFQLERPTILGGNVELSRPGRASSNVEGNHPQKNEGPARGTEEWSKKGPADDRGRRRRDPLATSPELVAVPPRRELRSQRLADANQLEPLRQPGQSDVLRRDPLPRPAERSLTRFDRLPALLERREVPTLAVAADDPEPTLRRVERQPSPDGERLDRFVRGKRRCAEDAVPIHGGEVGPAMGASAGSFDPP